MDKKDRYNRQMILPGFGKETQKKISEAKVIVIGAGGLGCPVLQYLTAAGIGHLGIVDFDKVEYSNLHRQVLFGENSIGKPKVEVAKQKLKNINSEIQIHAFCEKISNQNILTLLKGFDIVVDCTDNFQVRYILSDACAILNKPLIYGAIYQYEGQVSVFSTHENGMRTSYRDLFSSPPLPHEAPNCNEAGVLGTLAGLIGTLQANEVIKLITGIGDVLIGKLLVINSLNYNSQIFNYTAQISTNTPKTIEEFLNTNYDEICDISSSKIEIETIESLYKTLNSQNSILVDIRNIEEEPKIKNINYLSIPLPILKEEIDQLKDFESIVFVCQSGIRSAKAVKIAQKKFPKKNIKHVKNGIKTIIENENS